MSSLTFKRFDTYPPLGITLSSASGPVDLSTASSVHLEMKAQTGGTIIASLALASVIATAGYVQHPWNASETSMADTWNIEVEVKWANGGVQTFPNSGTETFTIGPDIEGS